MKAIFILSQNGKKISQYSKKRPYEFYIISPMPYQYQIDEAFYCLKLIEHYKIEFIKNIF